MLTKFLVHGCNRSMHCLQFAHIMSVLCSKCTYSFPKILISIDFSVMLLFKDFCNDPSSSEKLGFPLQNPAVIYIYIYIYINSFML